MSRDLHQALDTAVIDKHGLGGVNYVKVRLQHGKTDVTHSLHAEQTTFNLSGRFTEAHLLHRLGFAQSQCAFVGRGQCVAKEVPEDLQRKPKDKEQFCWSWRHGRKAVGFAIGEEFDTLIRRANYPELSNAALGKVH